MIRNDLTPDTDVRGTLRQYSQPSTTVPLELYGLTLQQSKETFYKDMPSSSKNYNTECDVDNKCTKDRVQYIYNLDSIQLQNKEYNKNKTSDVLNNGSRRHSDSVAQKANANTQSSSRFTTTLVSEDSLKAGPSNDRSNKLDKTAEESPISPVVTEAKSVLMRPGFQITDK